MTYRWGIALIAPEPCYALRMLKRDVYRFVSENPPPSPGEVFILRWRYFERYGYAMFKVTASSMEIVQDESNRSEMGRWERCLVAELEPNGQVEQGLLENRTCRKFVARDPAFGSGPDDACASCGKPPSEHMVYDHAYLSAGDNPHASGDRAYRGCSLCSRQRSEHER